MVLNNAGPRYYLTKIIKEGGQGAVYKAVGDDGETYAVKEMLDQFVDAKERAEGIARFEAEAQMMQRLVHPRIPRIYAYFHDEGKHYLAMEFVRGEDLEDIVAREGKIPEKRVLEWATQICDVLQFLHDQSMVYRDMKPSNVMLEANGSIKLIDLGIAKVLRGNTRGTQIGTPGYAPPEQYQGLATQASDVFALAATLHHLLTGRDPRDHQPFTFPPVRSLVPTISQRTADALAQALQMRPEDRYPTLGAFRVALGLPKPQPVRGSATGQTAQRGASTPPTPPPPAPAPAPVPAPAAPAQTAQRSASTPSPSPAPAAPAQTAQRGASTPSPSPAPAAPPATVTVGATGQTAPPAASPAPTQRVQRAPGPNPGRQSRGGNRARGSLNWFVALIIIAALGLIGWVGYQIVGGELSFNGTTTTGTPQTLVARPFVKQGLEIIVPAGTTTSGLDSAFAEAYLQLARLECGCNAEVQPGSLTYLNGEGPTQVETTSQGVRYRASLEGIILVPQ
jgi:eukaryotic-like serine/threonine-protein kinase